MTSFFKTYPHLITMELFSYKYWREWLLIQPLSYTTATPIHTQMKLKSAIRYQYNKSNKIWLCYCWIKLYTNKYLIHVHVHVCVYTCSCYPYMFLLFFCTKFSIKKLLVALLNVVAIYIYMYVYIFAVAFLHKFSFIKNCRLCIIIQSPHLAALLNVVARIIHFCCCFSAQD